MKNSKSKISMNWKPIQPIKDEVKAVEIDPEYPDLVTIEIPLNKKPEPEWEYFFENPKKIKEYTVPIHSQKVRGKRILIRADRDFPVDAVKNAYKYIKMANRRFQKFMEKKKDQAKRQAKERAEREEELKEITQEIRNL